MLLTDGAVAILEPEEGTKHIRTDIVRLQTDGSLRVATMPILPIPTRRDFRAAAMPGGRLMVTGGSNAEFRGCFSSLCRAETHVLDPKSSTWSSGPSMLEPRSEHLPRRYRMAAFL